MGRLRGRRWSIAALAPIAALLLLSLAACSDRSDPAPIPPPPVAADAGLTAAAPSGAPEFVNESFEQLYPVFLLRKLHPGKKAALWRRYERRWVRWTGTLVSVTPNGATFKHLAQTVTFDVSLWIDQKNRPKLRRFKVGDRITYIGTLDSYDDLFKTFYLVHGDLAAPP